MNRKFRNMAISAAVSSSLAVTGCATPGSGGAGSSSGTQFECNPFVLAGIGAALCGIVSKNRKVTDAAICAALAGFACYAFNNYQASQVKTAKQVSDDYLRTNRSLPDRPVVTKYVTKVEPARAAPRGGAVRGETEITVVPGKQGGPTDIQVEWTMYDAKGEKWLGPKKMPVNAAQKEAGQYKGGFDLKLAQELPQGLYEFRSTLYLDGQPVKNGANRVQVVVTDSDIKVAQAAE